MLWKGFIAANANSTLVSSYVTSYDSCLIICEWTSACCWACIQCPNAARSWLFSLYINGWGGRISSDILNTQSGRIHNSSLSKSGTSIWATNHQYKSVFQSGLFWTCSSFVASVIITFVWQAVNITPNVLTNNQSEIVFQNDLRKLLFWLLPRWCSYKIHHAGFNLGQEWGRDTSGFGWEGKSYCLPQMGAS